MAKYLINTARTLIFSTALPPPAVAAAAAALELLREQPRRVEKLQRNARVLREALVEAGMSTPAGDTPIVPLIVGDADAAVAASDRALEHGVFAQAIRPPTVPVGTSRLRLAVMASHTKSELREAGRRPRRGRAGVGPPSGGRVRGESAHLRRPGRRRLAPGPFPPGCAACSSPGQIPRWASRSWPRAICAALAARGERVAAFKPVVTGLGEPSGEWPPDHELLARAAGGDQTPEDVAPYRFDPPVSPHLAAELAGETIEPARMLQTARAAPERLLVAEGVGGLLVPLTPGYMVRDLAVDLGLPLVIAARTGLGTINHTLLTVEAARAAGLRVAGVVLTPWPARPGAVERSNRVTIERLGGVGGQRAPQSHAGRLWPPPAATCPSTTGYGARR